MSEVTFNLRFAGQTYDKEIGLFYSWLRSYSAGTGRYPRMDPIGLYGGSNGYICAINKL
jgi:RHS repeat-associated protein